MIPRLSPKEAEILRLLIANGEMYGLELVAASDLLKPGTIYVTLGRMADKGFVESRTEKLEGQSGLPRRLFKPTGEGSREAYRVRRRPDSLTQATLAWA
ncbi:MAG: PadR family transcriptional regulator [Acidobacteria bacterium]|nr:PadR family transcriptional regulator [Acidobacteriota bacterium]